METVYGEEEEILPRFSNFRHSYNIFERKRCVWIEET